MMCVDDHKVQSACDEKTKLRVHPWWGGPPLLSYTPVISFKSFLKHETLQSSIGIKGAGLPMISIPYFSNSSLLLAFYPFEAVNLQKRFS